MAAPPQSNETTKQVKSNDLQKEVTGRIRAEQALKKSEDRFRSLVEQTRDLIWEIDADFAFTYASPQSERLLGYAPHEIIGKSVFDLMEDQEAEDLRDLVGDIYIRQEPFSLRQAVIKHKNGKLILLETNGAPIFDTTGEFCGFRGISRDITDRQRDNEERASLQNQILKAQKLESLGILAGGIAHDFNNLLTSILSNVELARTEISSNSSLRNRIEEIETAAQRAAELSSQMLAYSGRGKFVVKKISLTAVLQDLSNLITSTVPRNIEINEHFPENLPAINADVDEIRQVVQNLVVNASEAVGDEQGLITIRTGAMHCDEVYLRKIWAHDELPEGLYATIEVMDNGMGMDEETRQRAFDPFFTTKFTGRGLGLAVVLGIVRGHKGAVRITSELGAGTSVTVLLPSLRSPSDSAPEPVISNGIPEGGTILLVDDEPLILRAGGSMLKRLGFQVLTAGDGEKAIEVFLDHFNSIDCVIMDLSMPNMDGAEALRELRKARKDIRVVLASGFSEHEIEEQSSNNGFSAFLQKPFQSDDLLHALEKAYSEPKE
ncbi:MAG: PAS domain S-box protein [Deltaproteobacteria bacterium]|nr:PAS domain S-box protein [Deltaproteobacteria bacterium]